jgi:hypothetical protein
VTEEQQRLVEKEQDKTDSYLGRDPKRPGVFGQAF